MLSNRLVLSSYSLIFGLLLSSVIYAQAPVLLYPMKDKPSVSSSFGTFRNSHHHAGLDLYAYETTPVIASADGTISLIKRSSSAYGRVLYINHANGYQTVYGHLSAFAPKIDRLVREEEKNNHAFKIKMYGGKRLSVKAGEIIGWAGTAGTDLVHLHYELRKNNLPVNPLTNGLNIPDTQAPKIKALFLQPKTTLDWLNGGQQALEIDLSKPENKVPHFEIWGDIRLAAQIEDTIDGSERSLTPYEFYLEIDGKKQYHIRHEENSYAEKGYTKYDFDLRYRGSQPRLVNRLYAYGPKFRQQLISQPTLFKHLKQGKHIGKIVAKDAKGNKTEVAFSFEIIKPLAQACQVALKAFPKGQSVKVETIKNASFTLNGFSFPILDHCENEHSPMLVNLKVNGVFEPQLEVHASKTKDQRIALTLALDQLKKGLRVPPKNQTMDIEIGIKAKVNGEEKEYWYQKRVFWFTAGQSYQDQSIRVQMIGSPHEPFLSAVDTESFKGDSPELKALTPLYRFHNPHQVTNGYYKFWIKRGKQGYGDHTGVYVHQEGKLDWASLGWHSDEISGYAGHLGEYVLLDDLNPPIIYPPLWLKHPAGPRLIIPLRERASELSKIDVLLDGKPIACEYQKAWQRFVFHPTSVLVTPENPKAKLKVQKPNQNSVSKGQKPAQLKQVKAIEQKSKGSNQGKPMATKLKKSKVKGIKKSSKQIIKPVEIIKPYLHFEYEGLTAGKHIIQVTAKDRTGHLVSQSFEIIYPPIQEYESHAQWPWEWWAELEKIYEKQMVTPKNHSVNTPPPQAPTEAIDQENKAAHQGSKVFETEDHQDLGGQPSNEDTDETED